MIIAFVAIQRFSDGRIFYIRLITTISSILSYKVRLSMRSMNYTGDKWNLILASILKRDGY